VKTLLERARCALVHGPLQRRDGRWRSSGESLGDRERLVQQRVSLDGTMHQTKLHRLLGRQRSSLEHQLEGARRAEGS
jgi:hypothetical protein